jgi:glycosyltransferase involved in cell wall biosynthesis
MNDIKISIITPSYNQGQFLERTILSIINQNYSNLEYIIIDGGSTDNSVEIIKKYENNITYWVSEKDNGQTDAINKGMRIATGDILGWINSDDILLPEALLNVENLAKKNPDKDLFMGRTVRIDTDDKILFFNIIPKMTAFFYEKGVFFFAQQSWFWRRSVFNKIGYLNIERHACMDMDFLIRQLQAGCKIAFTPRHLGAIRLYEGTKTSMDSNDENNIWAKDRKIMKEIYKNFHYQNSKKFYRYLYELMKVFNGMYLKQYYFNKRYEEKKISTFTEHNVFI